MKKLLFFIVILIGLPFFSSAQEEYHPFPTKNTVWAEKYHPAYGIYPKSFHYFALKNNDTIIKGNQYHKLYFSYDTIFTEDNICGGIREDNKRVYYYSIDSLTCLSTPIPTDTEIILYDFNLQVGDTITANQYRLRHADALVVAKIDDVLIGNDVMKRYTFGMYGYILQTEQWVEGVGCLKGLLSDVGDIPLNDFYSNLICFIQNSEVLYHSVQQLECYNKNPDAVQILSPCSEIKIMPNPIGSTIRIELDKIDYQKLILTDQSGRNIRQYKLQGIQTLSIERGLLPDGVYFFSVYDKKGVNQTLKVLLK